MALTTLIMMEAQVSSGLSSATTGVLVLIERLQSTDKQDSVLHS